MALRDTWHRTLVYFGLAEEDDYPTEERHLPEPEEELEDRYRDRPNVRRLERKRRRDESDDIYADHSPPPRRARALRPIRRAGARRRGTGRPTRGGGGWGRKRARWDCSQGVSAHA